MCASQNRPCGAIRRAQQALLLSPESPTARDSHLIEILDFLGIPWQVPPAGEFTDISRQNCETGSFCILSSAPYLAAILRSSQDSRDALPDWMKGASSVFVYGFEDTPPCKQLLRFLAGDAHGEIRPLQPAQAALSIISDHPEMCGPMSGLQVLAEPGEGDVVFDVSPEAQGFQSIIRSNSGELFFCVTRNGVRFYLSGGSSITDIRAPQGKYFDVKKHFSAAVPAVMYLKFVFPEVCWNSFETSGCLVIDDPLLKPRYGHLSYRQALELMNEHNFTTTIAFIPWNWRRTNPRTVNLFRERADRLSLCIHGSDHVGSEFATRSTARLNQSVKTARQRMELLEEKTALPHACVMVFPRGEFSPEAGRVLKLNGYVAAVNTEVAPAEATENQTTIADLWSMAILKYGTFPIFTRRYLTHGIENFAFDGLLGKPCLIVGHHEVFKSHGRELAEFIDKLNSLKWNLRWRPLGDLVRRGFRVRREANGTSIIQMFAHNLVVENPSGEPLEVIFLKEEGDPDCVKAVTVNQNNIDFRCDGRFVCWNVKLPAAGTLDIRIVYHNVTDSVFPAESLGYTVKTHARRYLSEFRDNYLSRSNLVFRSVSRIRQFLSHAERRPGVPKTSVVSSK